MNDEYERKKDEEVIWRYLPYDVIQREEWREYLKHRGMPRDVLQALSRNYARIRVWIEKQHPTVVAPLAPNVFGLVLMRRYRNSRKRKRYIALHSHKGKR